MGKATGFREFKRVNLKKEPPENRLKHYKEFDFAFSEEDSATQGARCMDCGVPFCHSNHGCPVHNVIPDFNDLVYRGHWKEALDSLHSTNNFPEFTGRLCPAICETSCTLGLVDYPVSIRAIERTIIDRGFSEGWIEPFPPKYLSGKKVAVVGSGPAGLAVSQELARAGHKVTLFEKNDRAGGLLRYGIPDFKLEKWIIDRRLEQMKIEGVEIRTGVNVGVDISVESLHRDFDAVILSMGSETPRDLTVPGRELNGVHFAMEFLTQQNKVNAGDNVENQITATGKDVVVIGGGDTGSDCVGTANRQGAKSVTQIELMPEPPLDRTEKMPWPTYPMVLRTSSSHEEGVVRMFSMGTSQFEGNNGNVTAVKGTKVKFEGGKIENLPGTEFSLKADLVLLALGFVHPVKNGVIAELEKSGLQLDTRGNIQTFPVNGDIGYETHVPGIFSCGDTRRGQSLIVWAIAEGRYCARQVHKYLQDKAKKD